MSNPVTADPPTVAIGIATVAPAGPVPLTIPAAALALLAATRPARSGAIAGGPDGSAGPGCMAKTCGDGRLSTVD